MSTQAPFDQTSSDTSGSVPGYNGTSAPYSPPDAPPAPPGAHAERSGPGTPYQQQTPPPAPYGAPPAHPTHGGPPQHAPGIGLIVVITLLFGALGAIPAAIRSKRAQELGLPGARYWKAFVITFVVGLLVYLGLIFGVIAVIAANATSTTPAPASANLVDVPFIEASVLAEGFQVEGGGSEQPSAVDCQATDVGPDGAGTYTCKVDFADGTTQPVVVTAAADGNLTAETD